MELNVEGHLRRGETRWAFIASLVRLKTRFISTFSLAERFAARFLKIKTKRDRRVFTICNRNGARILNIIERRKGTFCYSEILFERLKLSIFVKYCDFESIVRLDLDYLKEEAINL